MTTPHRTIIGLSSIVCGLLCIACGAPDVGPKSLPREPKGAVGLVSIQSDEDDVAAERNDDSDFSSVENSTGSEKKCRLDAPLPSSISLPSSVLGLHELGKKKITEKKSQAAVSILQLLVSREPQNAVYRADLATAMFQCGFVNAGIAMMEQALELDPSNVDILANLAQGYQIAGRFRIALLTYERAATLAPNDSEVRNNMAVVLVALGDAEQAEVQVRKAIAISPTHTEYWVDLGYILVRQKRLQDAEIVLKRAIQQGPDNADAFNMLGFVYFQLNHRERARENFKKALVLDPQHRAAKENLNAVNESFQLEQAQ